MGACRCGCCCYSLIWGESEEEFACLGISVLLGQCDGMIASPFVKTLPLREKSESVKNEFVNKDT